MVCERQFVKTWNYVSRSLGVGRPIFNYPVKTNFLELSPAGAESINKFWQKLLPLKGSDLKVDVLKNRRHQVLGVFLPAALAANFFIQFSYYQYTKVPDIVSQVPAPGWELPEGMHYHHIPATPANAAYWKKRTEMGHTEWDYGYATADSVSAAAHPWYHAQEHQAGGHH